MKYNDSIQKEPQNVICFKKKIKYMNAGIFSMQSIAIYKLKQRGLNLTPCRILYLFKKHFSVDHKTHSK